MFACGGRHVKLTPKQKLMSRLASFEASMNALSTTVLSDQNMLLQLLNMIRHPRNMGSLLGELCENETILCACASASYQHNNGFTKIVLARGDHWALRMHIHQLPDENHLTPAHRRTPAYHVHDHRWPFASTILRGTLAEDRYVPNTMPGEHEEQWQHFRYAPIVPDLPHNPGEPSSFKTEYIGAAAMTLVERIEHGTGTSYALGPDTLHAIPEQCEGCVTLVLTGVPRSGDCNLFSRNDVLPRQQTQKQPLDSTGLKAILQRELEACFDR
jgi:hypothetical protein